MAQDVATSRSSSAASGATSEVTRNGATFSPLTDIFETADHVVVITDMPGVAPDAVDITLEKRVLTIRGTAAADTHDGYRRAYQEYAEGDYERAFVLSEEIDRDKIEAEHRNGMLTLRMPKATGAKARKIGVKAG